VIFGSTCAWRGIGGLVCEYLPGCWVPVAEWIGVRRGTLGVDRGQVLLF